MAQNKTASVSPKIIIYAFKYAMNRNDYSTEYIANSIIENVKSIPKIDLYSIYKDVVDAKFDTSYQEEIWDKVAMAIENHLGDDLFEDE